MRNNLHFLTIVLLIGVCASASADSGGVGECYTGTEFPHSAVTHWGNGLASRPSPSGKRWKLSLSKIKDTCGIDLASFETEIVIQGEDLPDPKVEQTSRVDVPLTIAVPGQKPRFFSGHQYTPEMQRGKTETIRASSIYGSTDYRSGSSSDYIQCPNSDYRRRENESIQLTGLNTDSVPDVRVSFFKGVFAAGQQKAVRSCWLEYGGTAKLVSK